MSFQDEYKITNADRLDKGVYGLPDTPGMTTAAIQERFDSLGNLAIDKFNALVEAASDVVDGSDTKFPTNKAVQDYISGEGGAIIDDTTPSLHKAYSSSKVESMFSEFPSELIDDSGASATTVYSSSKVEEIVADLPTPESVIDDDTASTATTYSSSKLESDFISVSDTEEQTATDEFTTINGGLLSSCKVSLSPNQDLHGYDSPWVGGAGKNKADINDLSLVQNDSGNKLLISNLALTAGTYTMSFDVSKTITSTRNRPLYVISGVNTYAPSDYNTQGRGSWTFTLSADSTVTFYWWVSDNSLAVDITNFMLESGSSATAYEPYENICPISGHTQVEVEVGTNKLNPDSIVQGSLTTSALSTRCSTRGNLTIPISVGQTITVSKQSSTINFALAVTDSSMSVLFDSGWQLGSYTYVSAYNGYVELVFAKQDGTDIAPSNVKSANFMVEFGSTPSPYVPYAKGTYSLTVNLGGTYYSGTLDVVSGVFTPDTASVDLGTLTWSYTARYGMYTEELNAVVKKPLVNTDVAEIITSQYPIKDWNSFFNPGGTDQNACAMNTSGAIGISTPETNPATFKALMSGVQLVYKLATPTPFQLSPTMVKALVGENHLSAPLEGQEITESVYSPLAKWNAVIDDTTASDDTTYSSNKINSIVPQIDDNATSASKVFSSLKTANLITELSERFDFSTTEKPLGWWADGKVYYGKVINIMGCPKEMFGLMVDLGVEVDTFIGIFAVGNAKDDNYNGGYCMGGTIYCKVIKSEGQNTQIQPACAVMALGGASLLVLYTKVE